MRRPAGPFYDGQVHVLSDRCSTCVFRGGNLMQLQPGRLKDLVDSNVEADSALTCHQTLEYSKPVPGTTEPPLPAVCRGFFDAYKEHTLPLRLAVAMEIVTVVQMDDSHSTDTAGTNHPAAG